MDRGFLAGMRATLAGDSRLIGCTGCIGCTRAMAARMVTVCPWE